MQKRKVIDFVLTFISVKALFELLVPVNEYAAYRSRASFFNATARKAEGYLGLVFRRPAFVKVPEGTSALGKALEAFVNDADMLGTPIANYAKNVVKEVLTVGRAGTLMDWEALTQVLRWAYWWNSTEDLPDAVTKDQVVIELNTDFSTKGLSAQELNAIVAAWQKGAMSRDSMLELFRRGEVLPEGRTNEEEERLIEAETLVSSNNPSR